MQVSMQKTVKPHKSVSGIDIGMANTMTKRCTLLHLKSMQQHTDKTRIILLCHLQL
jgi:hypothetical protein